MLLKRISGSLIWLGICAFLFLNTFSSETVYLDPHAPDPMMYPRILILLIAVCACFLSLSQQTRINYQAFRAILGRLFTLVAIIAAYIWLLPFLGFCVAGFFLLFFIFLLLGYKGLLKNCLTSVSIVLLLWLCFGWLARIALPSGIFKSF